MDNHHDLSISANPSKPHLRLGKVKTLTPQERPQTRLMNLGPKQLDHASLMAIILGTAYGAEQDALHLSHRVINHLGSLRQLTHVRLDQLLKIKGIGPAKACRLLAVAEIAKRIFKLNKDQTKDQTKDNSAQDCLSYLQQLSHLVRCSNQYTQPLLIAFQIDSKFETTNQRLDQNGYLSTKTKESLDLAITLSLSSTLNDHQQHSRWLAQLLLSEANQAGVAWTMISYRLNDELEQKEIDSVSHLFDLSTTMGVNIHEVILISHDDQWALSPDESEK
ncbi:MAG: hypothetical protein CMH49_04515 [Myxococcales bacterium]|nr:hypothetical protein [Myxococcales bacterium]